MYQLKLASASPRRYELLRSQGFLFDVASVKISEIPNKNLNVKEQILDIARRKAIQAFHELQPHQNHPFVVLSADTEVIFNDELLGKPSSEQHATNMLRKLSGKSHQVVTALYLIESLTQKSWSHIETTEIKFRTLSDEEINKYIQTKDPFDKAGSYGIQSGARHFIESIHGSVDNVIGLPLEPLKKLFEIHQIEVNRSPNPFLEVQQKIINSCLKINRAPSSIQIMAVSKLQSEEKIRTLCNQNHFLFGENYIQEALKKIINLSAIPNIRWHYIGRIQKNKIKFMPGVFECIHSVSSFEDLRYLDQKCQKLGLKQKVLIQINIANELSKDGFMISDLQAVWSDLCSLSNIRIDGLMTMPPIKESPEASRPYFRELKHLLMDLKKKTDLEKHPLSHLSMGTSHDYLIAIEEGATIVRLGTLLFGERIK